MTDPRSVHSKDTDFWFQLSSLEVLINQGSKPEAAISSIKFFNTLRVACAFDNNAALIETFESNDAPKLMELCVKASILPSDGEVRETAQMALGSVLSMLPKYGVLALDTMKQISAKNVFVNPDASSPICAIVDASCPNLTGPVLEAIEEQILDTKCDKVLSCFAALESVMLKKAGQDSSFDEKVFDIVHAGFQQRPHEDAVEAARALIHSVMPYRPHRAFQLLSSFVNYSNRRFLMATEPFFLEFIRMKPDKEKEVLALFPPMHKAQKARKPAFAALRASLVEDCVKRKSSIDATLAQGTMELLALKDFPEVRERLQDPLKAIVESLAESMDKGLISSFVKVLMYEEDPSIRKKELSVYSELLDRRPDAIDQTLKIVSRTFPLDGIIHLNPRIGTLQLLTVVASASSNAAERVGGILAPFKPNVQDSYDYKKEFERLRQTLESWNNMQEPLLSVSVHEGNNALGRCEKNRHTKKPPSILVPGA